MTGVLPPLPFHKGGNGGGDVFINASYVISWFIRIYLKQIYYSYSRTQKLHIGLDNFWYYF